jgi:DNA polymerase III subunit epsilon
MRQIIFDTETTGFKPENGDRVVEIGAIEMVNGAITGNDFHVYVNPERDMPDGAYKVHGLSTEFLSDKPVFSDSSIGAAFHNFVKGAVLIAHNADFDMKFMQFEMEKAGLEPIQNEVIDTLQIARRKFPGSPASLDALCSRFGINTAERERQGHGALLDSRLLAEVYIELTGGRQAGLDLAPTGIAGKSQSLQQETPQRQTPLESLLSKEEIAAHEKFIAEMDNAIWATRRQAEEK